MKILLIPLLFLLSSCNSLNTVILTSYELSLKTTTDSSSVVVSEVNNEQKVLKQPPRNNNRIDNKDKIVSQCPTYIMPILEESMSFPIDEFNKIDSSDIKSLDKLLLKHIMDLVKLDKRNRELLDHTYQNYIGQCKQ